METSFLQSSLKYGRELVDEGIAGLREGRESYLNGKPVNCYLSESAKHCLTLTLIGAAAAAIPAAFAKPGSRVKNGVILGLAGATLGFIAGFGWNTRGLTRNMTRSANKHINGARDAHWLENNPITYA